MAILQPLSFVLFMILSLPSLALLLLTWALHRFRTRSRVRMGYCLLVGLQVGAGLGALLVAVACLAGEPSAFREIPGGPDAPRVPTFPLPEPHPSLRLVDVRVKDGDTVHGRLIGEAGSSLELDIRLAPTAGKYNASDKDKSPARRRLEGLLTGGPFWVQLTGDRTFERWVGRVFHQVDAEVPSDHGVRIEPRLENVADRMKAEGFDVPRGE